MIIEDSTFIHFFAKEHIYVFKDSEPPENVIFCFLKYLTWEEIYLNGKILNLEAKF